MLHRFVLAPAKPLERRALVQGQFKRAHTKLSAETGSKASPMATISGKRRAEVAKDTTDMPRAHCPVDKVGIYLFSCIHTKCVVQPEAEEVAILILLPDNNAAWAMLRYILTASSEFPQFPG